MKSHDGSIDPILSYPPGGTCLDCATAGVHSASPRPGWLDVEVDLLPLLLPLGRHFEAGEGRPELLRDVVVGGGGLEVREAASQIVVLPSDVVTFPPGPLGSRLGLDLVRREASSGRLQTGPILFDVIDLRLPSGLRHHVVVT